MATSSQIYAHIEHNKNQRKPAVAGGQDLETFGIDCKGCGAGTLQTETSITRDIARFPLRQKALG
jgi:hypothetical protein